MEKQVRKKRWLGVLLFCSLVMAIAWTGASKAEENAGEKAAPTEEANFPDAGFRSYLLQRYDANQNQLLDAEELKGITKVSVSKRNIRDLKGIERLTNLKELECDDNYLSTLDLSKNKELVYLDCSGNDLAKLDVKANVKLETLLCNNNGMRNLELDGNAALVTLDGSNNRLLSLQTEGLEKLTSLDVSANQLLHLNVSKNGNLQELLCSRNAMVTLDLSGATKLKKYLGERNQMTSLVLPETSTLTEVDCSDNRIHSLDVAKAPNLKTLKCEGNQLAALDVSQLSGLEILHCADNRLASMDLSANLELTSLDVRNNQLAYLDVQAQTALGEVKASGNVRDVYVQGEQFPAVIDISRFTGFSHERASAWENMGSVQAEGQTLLMALYGDPDLVSFTYAMSDQASETFRWNPVMGKRIVPYHSELSMTVGDKLPLMVEALGGDVEMAFASSDDSIVKVEGGNVLLAEKGGAATVTVSAQGYEPAVLPVTVLEKLEDLTLKDIPVQTLAEGGAKPEVTLSGNGKELVKEEDYEAVYINNDKVGMATVILTGKGRYSFELIKEFQVCYDIGAMVADEIVEQAYTGKELFPQVILRNGSVILKQDVDYSIAYANNQNPGTAIVTIKGVGEYAGEKLMTFNIKIPQVVDLVKSGNESKKISLTWKKIEDVDGYRVYKYNATTGKYERAATLKGNDKTSYTDTACVTGTVYRYRVRAMVGINGKNEFGSYSKILKTTSKLAKAALKASAGKTGSRLANLSWNKVTSASGYRIYMKEGKTGAYVKVKTIEKAGTKKFTMASLTRGKVYYFRMRAYKKVNGVNVFGTYSAQKKVKVK